MTDDNTEETAKERAKRKYQESVGDAAMNPDGTRECVVCGEEIDTAELCEECAEGNDPFDTSDYGKPHRGRQRSGR